MLRYIAGLHTIVLTYRYLISEELVIILTSCSKKLRFYLGNATRPAYKHDSKMKTELRKTIRGEIRESMKEVLSVPETDFSPQIIL